MRVAQRAACRTLTEYGQWCPRVSVSHVVKPSVVVWKVLERLTRTAYYHSLLLLEEVAVVGWRRYCEALGKHGGRLHLSDALLPMCGVPVVHIAGRIGIGAPGAGGLRGWENLCWSTWRIRTGGTRSSPRGIEAPCPLLWWGLTLVTSWVLLASPVRPCGMGVHRLGDIVLGCTGL